MVTRENPLVSTFASLLRIEVNFEEKYLEIYANKTNQY
jgi:hypothetical protein